MKNGSASSALWFRAWVRRDLCGVYVLCASQGVRDCMMGIRALCHLFQRLDGDMTTISLLPVRTPTLAVVFDYVNGSRSVKVSTVENFRHNIYTRAVIVPHVVAALCGILGAAPILVTLVECAWPSNLEVIARVSHRSLCSDSKLLNSRRIGLIT